MNYLQRFSADLAAWEKRQREQVSPAPEVGDVQAQESDSPADREWLSEVQTVARQLSPRGRRNDPGVPRD